MFRRSLRWSLASTPPPGRIVAIASLVIFTGCAVATWGGAYHVLNATPDQIVIEYDRVLTNPSLLMPLVTEHCAKYGKQPYMANLSRTIGIGTIQFDCR
jgi:hypothetical protein